VLRDGLKLKKKLNIKKYIKCLGSQDNIKSNIIETKNQIKFKIVSHLVVKTDLVALNPSAKSNLIFLNLAKRKIKLKSIEFVYLDLKIIRYISQEI